MNARHRRTLAALFARPTATAVTWDALVGLLGALGATVAEKREGSRVAVALRGAVFVLHRPHPRKEIDPAVVRELRQRLTALGLTPDAVTGEENA